MGNTRGQVYWKSGDSGIFCMGNAVFELMRCQQMASLLWEIMRRGGWREIGSQLGRGKGNSKVNVIIQRLDGVIKV